LLGLLIGCLLSGLAAGADAAVPYGFTGLEMYKVSWDTLIVAFGDVNGDGLTDIVVPENARARILCLIQRRNPAEPVAEAPALNPNDLADDTRFEKRPYLAGKQVVNLALGDLNGDGRTDMAYYGDPPELVVVYQSPKGEWGEKKSFDISDGSQHPHTMLIADFNGDKRLDICLLGKDSTYFIYQDAKGVLEKPVKHPGVPEGVFALVAGDFNGDGRLDLLYAAGNEDEPFSVRLQDNRGRMSPNVPLKVAQIRAMISGDLDMDGRDEVLSVERATGRLVVHKLGQSAKVDGLVKGQPRCYPFPPSGSQRPRSMAVADLDGDGRPDVLVTNPAASELEWYHQDESGALLLPERYPTLQSASDVVVADLDGDGRPEILVLSPDEQTLGLARRSPGGRIEFPARLFTEGKPTAVGVGDLDGDGKPEIVYATASGFDRSLAILKAEDGGYRVHAKLPVQAAKSDVDNVVVADADQDGKPDILAFEQLGGLRVFVQGDGGKFADVSLSANYGQGLVRKTRSVGFALGDVTGDGKPEMLIAQGNFARALRLERSGALQVVDQFNGLTPDSRIEGCAAADLDGDGVNEVLLLDAQAKVISVLKRQASGAYAIVQNVPVGTIRLRGMTLMDFDRDKSMDVLVFSTDKMVTLLSSAPHLELQEIAAYETETKGGVLADVSLGDLNGDGRPDLILNESSQNAIEILSYDRASAAFTLRMRFQVFEKKTFPGRGPRGGEGARIEPRSMEIADVTNDGKSDLILVVHDRLNVYPQD